VGKGDGTINYYELVNDDKKIYGLGSFRNTEPQKGGGWVAKKGLDVWKCEVGRFLKLNAKSITPISFIVPRKSGEEVFQADIYPDAFAGKPALSAEEWTNGQNKNPILMSLDPTVRQDLNQDEDGNVQFVKKRTYQELADDNGRLKARVKELEIKLGIYDPSKDENNEENVEEEDNNGDDNNADNNVEENNENTEQNNDNENNDDQKED